MRTEKKIVAKGVKLAAKGTVARTIEDALLKGKSTDQVVAQVKRQHRHSTAGPKDVAYYRWLMRNHGGVREAERGTTAIRRRRGGD